MDKKKEVEGILYGILSYVIWGIVPIYWKFIDHVSSTEILAHRELWSFEFMIILLLILKQFTEYKGYIKEKRDVVFSEMNLTLSGITSETINNESEQVQDTPTEDTQDTEVEEKDK